MREKITNILRQGANILVELADYIEEVSEGTWTIVFVVLAVTMFVTGAIFFAPVSPYSQGLALFGQSASIGVVLFLLGLVSGSKLTARSLVGVAVVSGFILMATGVMWVMPKAIRYGFNDYVLEASWDVFGQIVLASFVPGFSLSLLGKLARRKLRGY